jgi:Ca2+-binding RTX toxin-like protein
LAIFNIIGDTDWSSYADLAGGTIIRHSAKSLLYTSDTGFKVTLHGTGFVFDALGIPTGGIITGLDVVKGGVHLAQYTGLTTALTSFATLGLGQTSGAANTVPDMTALYTILRVGDDVINANNLAKSISGYDGNDTIFANGGDDWMSGGKGVDVFYGGSGANGVYFFDGVDTKHGVSVNLGLLTGNILDDGYGNVETATEVENVEGSNSADHLTGGIGDNALFGLDGNDQISGAGGNDTLYGGAGNDVLLGGDGDDVIGGNLGKDRTDGGAGIDELVFVDVATTGHGVVVNLSSSVDQVKDDGYGNSETAANFELVSGSDFGDSLTGNAAANAFWGYFGNDTLIGDLGDDFLYGGGGGDHIFGGSGSDTIVGGNAVDKLTGGADSDFFYFLGATPGADGVDQIRDFVAGQDGLVLNVHWAADMSLDGFLATQFRSGAGAVSATTAAQRLVYNTLTGNLYFDADGLGGQASVLLLTLTNHAALTYDRIFTVEPF